MVLSTVDRLLRFLVVFHGWLQLDCGLWSDGCDWLRSLYLFWFKSFRQRRDRILLLAQGWVNIRHVSVQYCSFSVQPLLFEDALSSNMLSMVWWMRCLFRLFSLLNTVFIGPSDAAWLLIRTAFSSAFTIVPLDRRLWAQDHLGIDESVPQDDLIVRSWCCLYELPWNWLPKLSHGWIALTAPSHLPLLQLLQEWASDLQIWPSWVDELERLHHWPIELLHQVDAYDAAGAALTTDWVHQDAIVLICSLVDEVLDLVSDLIVVIEQKLSVVI